MTNFSGALQRQQQDSQDTLSQRFLHKLRSSVQSRSLTAGSPAGNSPVPCPGAVPSNNPTSKLRAIAAYSAGMQGAIANGSSSLETVVGTDPIPSLGQKMAQSQASWQPLPVGTWPLVASSAPSAAAYSMPTHHSRHQGLQTPSAPRPHAGCYQQHSKSQSHSEVSTVMQMESLQHESAIPGSEHISGITQTAHLASHIQLSDTTCPSNLDSRVVHLPPQHISQGGLQQPAPARSHTAQLLHQIDTDSVENMQQAGMHAAEAGLAGSRQPQASLESGILDNQHQQPQQQQPQQQQQSVRADSSVLEWCSRADELLQLSAAPGEAAPMQAALPGSLQTGLTILPAYSGATFSPWTIDRSQSSVGLENGLGYDSKNKLDGSDFAGHSARDRSVHFYLKVSRVLSTNTVAICDMHLRLHNHRHQLRTKSSTKLHMLVRTLFKHSFRV